MVGKFCPEIVGGIAAAHDANQDIISYTDYLTNAKMQVASAKQLQKMLAQYSQQVSQILSS